MKSQVIVAIGREHGSGGHTIAEEVAQRLQIQLFDKKWVEETLKASGYSPELIDKMDEKPVNYLSFRRIGEYSNSLEQNIAEKTFELLRSRAEAGESFVVVGRCADYILRKNPNLLRVFISGEKESKIQRIMQTDGVKEAKAAELIHDVDRRRKMYHNFYCDTKWGDSRHYDFMINSGKFGIDKTVDILVSGIQAFAEV